MPLKIRWRVRLSRRSPQFARPDYDQDPRGFRRNGQGLNRDHTPLFWLGRATSRARRDANSL